MCIYVYMYTCVHIYIYIYICIFMGACQALGRAVDEAPRARPQVVRLAEPSNNFHTCHILPPSEIDLGLCLAVLQAQEGNICFTELAERVEYGNYDFGGTTCLRLLV